MNKKLTIINIALTVVAIFLAYMVYHSISQPVIFENTKTERELKVVQNLKDIRSTQGLFKENYNRYTASFDTLIETCCISVIVFFEQTLCASDVFKVLNNF